MTNTSRGQGAVLDDSAMYFAADRVVCASIRCAGYRAVHTGVGIDGVVLERVTVGDVEFWGDCVGGDMRCGCGARVARVRAGSVVAVPAGGGTP